MPVIVEIGSLREPVEIIDPPRGGLRPRTGRIRHANGENAAIDFETLCRLERRAREAELEQSGHRSPRSILLA